MAKNNDRNRNGGSDRNTADMADIDVGEAVGTAGGGVVGAVVGSALGPIGTVAGAIAGAALGNKVGEGVEGNDDTANQQDQQR
ncbi:glycine zipper 2TM domain-containing protein [Paenibacillus piri]|uniref:Glycine zipper 2TM domain-containing protein n=1 Tax=Paenibacillus piri TaxID=2547395 RepID=A0A4R5K8A3_9BACL|nr:glycine zipper 2TM domain-containing protein [Paenibacillus piri]TDF91032.1 glycine zipper 2TM domain-containing protein [Paenibacillus piri]